LHRCPYKADCNDDAKNDSCGAEFFVVHSGILLFVLDDFGAIGVRAVEICGNEFGYSVAAAFADIKIAA
jgi:hypothetical protein